MQIRRAKTDDAAAACTVLRRSITELCRADHGGDEILLGKWLSNKTVENVARWILESHFVVAEEGEIILGVAAMNASGKIALNYVSPEARFRGVSKALVRRRGRSVSASVCWRRHKRRSGSIRDWDTSKLRRPIPFH